MDDEMALFEAELSNLSTPAEEHADESAPQAAQEEKKIEEAPKLSLLEQAKLRWKPKSKADTKALELEAKGKWEERKDAEGTYYYNSVSKVTTRTKPSDFIDRSLDPIVIGTTVWTVSRAPISGELFYTNKETGESTCKRPGEPEAPAKHSPASEKVAVAGASGAETAPSAEDPDEVIDLVGNTKPSQFEASDRIYARVLAESEEGISIVGFNLRLNTPLAKLMEAWADYMEVPVPSVYFEFDGKVLAATETPSKHGWTPERGTFKIEAKPCEEIECSESEEDEEETRKRLLKDQVLAEWKKEQKDKKRARKV
eukprot:TRINITY_DN8962_c0_g1_i1.p1 TRINITY_DN8962_c0_g1~~TRINITY_DN8962_c0_g1_i1.p1  ORF type:complete len:313 (-),score=72.14 TRINITY_DN8962_c0_g1_i1:11-949(-)